MITTSFELKIIHLLLFLSSLSASTRVPYPIFIQFNLNPTTSSLCANSSYQGKLSLPMYFNALRFWISDLRYGQQNLNLSHRKINYENRKWKIDTWNIENGLSISINVSPSQHLISGKANTGGNGDMRLYHESS